MNSLTYLNQKQLKKIFYKIFRVLNFFSNFLDQNKILQEVKIPSDFFRFVVTEFYRAISQWRIMILWDIWDALWTAPTLKNDPSVIFQKSMHQKISCQCTSNMQLDRKIFY